VKNWLIPSITFVVYKPFQELAVISPLTVKFLLTSNLSPITLYNNVASAPGIVKPAPSASGALEAFFAIVIFLSSTVNVVTLRVVVSPCTVKLPATYRSLRETSCPVKPIAALTFVK